MNSRIFFRRVQTQLTLKIFIIFVVILLYEHDIEKENSFLNIIERKKN